MIYIGIDPGKSGAMAMISDLTKEKVLIPFDESVYAKALRECIPEETKACVEHVTAMPGQGVTSMFNFGQNFGYIKGLLTAYQIPYELVRPQKWKKEFSVTGDKNSSIEVCKRLFPGVSLRRTERCRKDDDGLAEALLLAEFARRRL